MMKKVRTKLPKPSMHSSEINHLKHNQLLQAKISVFLAGTGKFPYVFWFVGGTDAIIYLEAKKNNQINPIPSNHSPQFAPVIHPTLKTGLQAMMIAAVAWLD